MKKTQKPLPPLLFPDICQGCQDTEGPFFTIHLAKGDKKICEKCRVQSSPIQTKKKEEIHDTNYTANPLFS